MCGRSYAEYHPISGRIMGAYSLGCLGYVCPHETWILSAKRRCTRVNVMYSGHQSRPHKIYVLGPRMFIVFEAIFTVFAPATYGCVLFTYSKYDIIGVGFCPQENRRQTVDRTVFGVERTLFGIKQAVFCIDFGAEKKSEVAFLLMRRHVIQNPSKDGRTGASLQNTKEAPLQQEHPLLQRT